MMCGRHDNSVTQTCGNTGVALVDDDFAVSMVEMPMWTMTWQRKFDDGE